MNDIDKHLLHDLKNVGVRLSSLIDLYRDEEISEKEFRDFMDEIKNQLTSLWKTS